MSIRELREKLGETQAEFAKRYKIPFRTIQNWETGMRKPPEYVMELLEYRVKEDLINRKTVVLPAYDTRKKDLPKRIDYVGTTSWLKAIKEEIGEDVVFALDEALMCLGFFNGRNDEYLIWIYGPEKAKKYNGVVVLGNEIGSYYVNEKNGLKFTDFNRTLNDALANESILDYQGITEAISYYYYSNDEKLDGIFIAPEYQERFDMLMQDAMDYYNS